MIPNKPFSRWRGAILIAALALGGVLGAQSTSGGWETLSPGAPTACSDGSPYQFYFRPQGGKRLLIYLEGGGACWNAENCPPGERATYVPRLVDSITHPGLARPDFWRGIFDFDQAANPFRDYDVLVVPYCTGDVHLGNRLRTYGKGAGKVTIAHRGLVNLLQALEWVQQRVPAAQNVFVCGASAGALGAPIAAEWVAQHYPQARIACLADGASAYRGNNFASIMEAWGVAKALKKAAIAEKLPLTSFSNVQIALAQRRPQVAFAAVNAAHDEVQQFFMQAIGDDPSKIALLMQENLQGIAQQCPNFHHFTFGGKQHTILKEANFYAMTVQNVSLRQWVLQLAEGARIGNVGCGDCGE